MTEQPDVAHDDDPETMRSNFQRELEELLNKHCVENASNTPDLVLANYLMGCLLVFETATNLRDIWWGNESMVKSETAQAALMPTVEPQIDG